jgi:outer membrane protein insertion porin family
VRWLIAVGVGAVLCAGAAGAFPRTETRTIDRDAAPALLQASAPIIDKMVFLGLRRIAPKAVEAQISTRENQRLDSRRIENDVRSLARLGWFSEIRVETRPAAEFRQLDSEDPHAARRVRVEFYVEELPFLAEVEFTGSPLLSKAQIDKMLSEKQLSPRLGEPADPVRLTHIAQIIRTALAELGHPESCVQIERRELSNATVRVRFEIADGPHIPVGRIDFEGNPALPPKLLREQMQRVAPGELFASLRGKDSFTKDGFEEDRGRILTYYQNHGYPEARVGNARPSVYEKNSLRWFSWRHRKRELRLAISVPVEAGTFYHQTIEVTDTLNEAGGKRAKRLREFSAWESGKPYSARAIDNLRRAWLTSVQSKHVRGDPEPYRNAEASRTLDPEQQTVFVKLRLSEAPPFIVRRIDFRGTHRFSDRYLRRRILLQEGPPLDDRALEAGLARLARTGYFHKIRQEDINVQTDELTRTANVTIHLSEAGQQRALFSGGHGQFGSTLGIAYTLFDLFQRDELLSAQLDAGPESLQLILGLVKEGFLGSRGALAFSLFNNVLRPRFASGPKAPFYNSQSEGINASWSYALTNVDSVAVNYGVSRTNSDYSVVVPANLAGLASGDIHAQTTSRSVGLGWTHDSGNQQIKFANAVSGGVLGGNENMLRSSAEYSRIFADPFFHRQNSWAFRTIVTGAGSYKGNMPFYARFFSGDELVRGLRTGELGPEEVASSISAAGNQTYTAVPAGANLIAAANAEYRMPLRGGIEAAGFFDLGSGRLLPNWLGPTRPTLLDGTNAILHGSTGIELRWTVPGVQVPVRTYYAVNVLRLNRFLQLPDGSLFHAHNRFSAFGWALGSLF